MKYQDFQENPKKYELFKTARIKNHIFTENGKYDIPENTFLAISFYQNVFNAMYNRIEPVYKITWKGEIMHLFGNCFDKFCL